MKEDGDENPGFVPKTIEYFRTEVEIIPLSPQYNSMNKAELIIVKNKLA
jgi:hypothetical protein